jgi:hypothetical protein
LNEGRAKTLNQMRESLALLGRILSEAAQLHGDNWEEVEGYIKERIATLPDDQQTLLVEEMDRILRFRAPPPSERPN